MTKWLAAATLLNPLLNAHPDTPVQPPLVHRFQVGPDIFWSHYRSSFEGESREGQFKASLDGYYGGLRGGYDYLQSDALYAGTEAIVAWGRDDLHTTSSFSYNPLGCTECVGRSKHEKQTRVWIHAEQRLGYNSQSTVFPEFIATPYLGLGWHYEGTSHDHTYWYYGALGLKTVQKFYPYFALGVDLKLMYSFDIHDKGFVSITTTQGKKNFWGFETALALRWLLGAFPRWDVELKPYLLKLNLNSPQTVVGVRFMVGYSF